MALISIPVSACFARLWEAAQALIRLHGLNIAALEASASSTAKRSRAILILINPPVKIHDVSLVRDREES